MKWIGFSFIVISFHVYSMDHLWTIYGRDKDRNIIQKKEFGSLEYRNEVNFINDHWKQAINALLDNNIEKMKQVVPALTKVERDKLVVYACWMRDDRTNTKLIQTILNIQMPDQDASTCPSLSSDQVSASRSSDAGSPRITKKRTSISLPSMSPRSRTSKEIRRGTPRQSLSSDDVINHNQVLSRSLSADNEPANP